MGEAQGNSLGLNLFLHFSSPSLECRPPCTCKHDSLVHGAVLTAQVTSPCWATTTAEQLNYFLSCEPLHSVLKFAFQSPWCVPSFIHSVSRKDHPVAS